MVVVIDNEGIGSLNWQKRKRRGDCPILKMSVNNFQLCIIGHLNENWLQTSVNAILAAFRGKI